MRVLEAVVKQPTGLNPHACFLCCGANVEQNGLQTSPYDDILPFLQEHVQPSDQLLVFGASNDFALRLAKDGYGQR